MAYVWYIFYITYTEGRDNEMNSDELLIAEDPHTVA